MPGGPNTAGRISAPSWPNSPSSRMRISCGIEVISLVKNMVDSMIKRMIPLPLKRSVPTAKPISAVKNTCPHTAQTATMMLLMKYGPKFPLSQAVT